MTERKQQMLNQYRVVVHLARTLALVHEQCRDAYQDETLSDGMIEMLGYRSAEIMEYLGDILNDMNANDTEDDAWVDPIFETAHEMDWKP